MTELFNRKLIRHRRDRAAARNGDDFLYREIATRLDEKLADLNRDFKDVLCVGSGTQYMQSPKIKHRFTTDLSRPSVQPTQNPVVADEESLPFKNASFDLIVSNLCLHHVNHLPQTLNHLNRLLKPDGFFLAALWGGKTLTELRQALTNAELILSNGAANRIAPFAQIHDLAACMQHAQFALPVIDSEIITVEYKNIADLMNDLRSMGETNALKNQAKPIPNKQLFHEAQKQYAQKFKNQNNNLDATFEVIYLAGWHKHESQQKPLLPGSAIISLAESLDAK